MPTYQYICNACKHTFEHMQGIKANKLKRCPKCDKNALKREIGTGGGIIFRGEPFSASTEYLSKNQKKKKDKN